MLLDGWFTACRLDKVGKLLAEMCVAGLHLLRGCLLDKMREERIDSTDLVTCNPVVHPLIHAGRFRDAYKLLEKFPIYGVTPNISSSQLVLGHCRYGDVAGASSVLRS